VRAANVKSTLDAFKLLPAAGIRLIERFHLKLDDLRPDNFVPVQSWLDALHELSRSGNASILRTVGSAIIENADFPPTFQSVEDVLLALDAIYHMNHKGDVGHYRVSQLDDGSVEIRCETPYPRQFERGLVEGIARHKRLTKGASYGVEYADGPQGADHTCTLRVRKK